MSEDDLYSSLDARIDRLEKRLLQRQQLTSRQREVLILMADGKVGKEIAYALAISPKTVECHKATIRSTLHLDTAARLIRFAVEQGFVGSEAITDEELRAEIQALRKRRELIAPDAPEKGPALITARPPQAEKNAHDVKSTYLVQ
jgi:DNA-binding CsgD family transcriptional regulator